MNRHEIDVIESNVTIQNVLLLHNVPYHGARCRCPLHGGDRLSFSFNDKLFHCFTCGEGGGVIQLEARLDGVDEDTACRRLARAFALDISDEPWTDEDKINWKLGKAVERDHDDYTRKMKSYYTRLSTLYRNIANVPELSDLASNLNEWLDENINGVVQPWRYLNME